MRTKAGAHQRQGASRQRTSNSDDEKARGAHAWRIPLRPSSDAVIIVSMSASAAGAKSVSGMAQGKHKAQGTQQ
jgi:hypothetical protein